jgi:hypothetical protein
MQKTIDIFSRKQRFFTIPDVTNEIIFCINIRLKILNFEYVLSFTAVVQEEEIELKSTYPS